MPGIFPDDKLWILVAFLVLSLVHLILRVSIKIYWCSVRYPSWPLPVTISIFCFLNQFYFKRVYLSKLYGIFSSCSNISIWHKRLLQLLRHYTLSAAAASDLKQYQFLFISQLALIQMYPILFFSIKHRKYTNCVCTNQLQIYL